MYEVFTELKETNTNFMSLFSVPGNTLKCFVRYSGTLGEKTRKHSARGCKMQVYQKRCGTSSKRVRLTILANASPTSSLFASLVADISAE